jgi:hypothetical protein
MKTLERESDDLRRWSAALVWPSSQLSFCMFSAWCATDGHWVRVPPRVPPGDELVRAIIVTEALGGRIMGGWALSMGRTSYLEVVVMSRWKLFDFGKLGRWKFVSYWSACPRGWNVDEIALGNYKGLKDKKYKILAREMVQLGRIALLHFLSVNLESSLILDCSAALKWPCFSPRVVRR